MATNLIATAVLLGAARAAGLSRAELGLDPRRVGAGLRWGGAFAAVVVAGCAAGVAVPATRPLFADARVAGAGAAELAHDVLVRIPLGTVLWEETAFRGVLLAVLARLLAPRTAVVASALLFGVWHVRPTASAVAANDLAGGAAAQALLVALGCLVTVGAGLLFAWLRVRSGSLLAPVLLHLATNTSGLLAAAVAQR
ncbi:CPBP family intramembrane metalloprotease [Geodermatophilus marinus]|nr:CPBP family intramembrane metalloprotease [Geodermatophilus sp. LHW52908]